MVQVAEAVEQKKELAEEQKIQILHDRVWQRIQERYPNVPMNMKAGFFQMLCDGKAELEGLQKFCQGAVDLSMDMALAVEAAEVAQRPPMIMKAQPAFIEKPAEQWTIETPKDGVQKLIQNQFLDSFQEAAEMVEILKGAQSIRKREFFYNLNRANPALVQYIDDTNGRYAFRHGMN